MSINTSIGLVGVAKQASRDTGASAPTYVHGLTGGNTFAADRTVGVDEVACGMRANVDAYVEKVSVAPSFQCRAYADALGLYLLGALGEDDVDGESAPYTHVFTMGSALPYLTMWGQTGTDNITCVGGCKVDELELSFDGNKPLDVSVTLRGLTAALGLSALPGSVEPSCFDGYFVPTAGTFKLDTASDTPAASAIVTKGSVKVSNKVEETYGAGRAMPSEVSEGKCEVSGSVTCLPDDMTLYRKMLTGSSSGTAPSASVVYGSFEWTFTHRDEAGWTLKVEADHVPFKADWVDVDPSGGDGEVEFSFDQALVAELGGSPVTITLVNDVASY